jgi:serine/threonine-protein kinase
MPAVCLAPTARESFRQRRAEVPLVASSEQHVDTLTQASREDPRSDPALGAPVSGPTRRFQIGQRVGNDYEIKAVLGEGGMGTVYEALDVGLNRIVALKVPLVAGGARTLRREAQGLAAVHHPNLLSVYALGQHEGIDFIVMERIHGLTLEARLDDLAEAHRRLSVAEVVDLLLAITDGLSAIHHAGLAHRDLKLANVMVAGSRVVVTDFGLVTPEFEVPAGSRLLAGSIDSLAPELIRDDVHLGQGPLVDLYALGVLAFELLTGHAPYASESAQEVLLGHLEGPVPDVRVARPDVPAELAELLLELMAKSPEDRPESAEVVLWRLGALQAAVAPRPAVTPLSVLIVDDDGHVCKALQRSLTAALPRLEVEATTRPETAVDRIERRRPDIVLVDLSMPGVNGVELCMQILALPRAARPEVVAMSAEATPDDLRVLASLGIARFVPKDPRFVTRMCEVIGELRRLRA